MSQSFQNHARYIPAFHFFALPILIINAVVAVKHAVSTQDLSSALAALVAIALFLGVFYGRVMPLTAQDRVIRLEETLRLQRILPTEQQGDIAALSAKQLVALRFASDAELPDLVRRTKAGEFAKPSDIKRAIKNWRADYLRV